MKLAAIANIIRDQAYGWTLVSAGEPIDIEYERITQNQETDLEFLHRLARENNYIFTVKGGQLFCSRGRCSGKRGAITTFQRGDGFVTSGNFKAKTRATYKAATVSIRIRHKATHHGGAEGRSASCSGDTPTRCKCKSKTGQDAAQKAKAALHEANMLIVTGTLEIYGRNHIPTGKPIAIKGFGDFDGKYIIAKAIHRLSRDKGYSTQLEVAGA